MKRKFSKLLSFCFLLLALEGCGYTTRSMISSQYKSIYVTPFVNLIDFTKEAYAANKYRVSRPHLETDITRAVTDKYYIDGNLRPDREDSADLILKGELAEFRRDPLRYMDNDEVEEYRLNLIVNITLYDREEKRVVWQELGFTGDTTYFPQAKSEDVAVNDALKDLARRIVERTVEQW
jgi:hypothetical protein